ncbi:MAG: LysM peptidoglycan-binding domain-containing protein [Chloroflexi bacterium]|nr:LysM peptidoglycan-binding domain-containing protein [Chloroflexota bacterium]
MELRRSLPRAGALAGLVWLLAAPAAPAVSPALLMSPTPTATPVAAVTRGPRIYKLPFPGGASFDVCQGNNHAGGTHVGAAAYAWDFCMDVGTPVTASRGGTVRMVRQESNMGGWGAKFANDANFIVIDHGDGTSTLYMHLMLHGARVKVGDQVQTGQLIGYSGNTGWTSAPHLHFMVMKTEQDNYYAQSLPVLFSDVPGDGLPLEDNTYTSGNAPVDRKYWSPDGPPPFSPFWVESFKATTLWSGSDDKAVSFGPAGPWQYFQVTAPQSGSRLQVVVAASGSPAFVPAADVGPSGPPPATPVQGPPATPNQPAAAASPSPTAKPADTPTASAGGSVVVAAGDTLSAIARSHGIAVDQLLAINHLTDPNQLFVGQTLQLSGSPAPAPAPQATPSPAPSTPPAATPAPSPAPQAAGTGQVTVSAGDTVFAIARSHNVTVDQVLKANGLSDDSRIFAGQVLKLS